MGKLKKLTQFLKALAFIGTAKNYKEYLSYAQAGEDRVLKFLFTSMGKQKISYLEIGTNNPIAKLHVVDSSVLFSAAFVTESSPFAGESAIEATPIASTVVAATAQAILLSLLKFMWCFYLVARSSSLFRVHLSAFKCELTYGGG